MAASGSTISVVLSAAPPAIAVAAAGGPAVAVTAAACAAVLLVGFGIYKAVTRKGRA